jgi:copper chaperone CopZ
MKNVITYAFCLTILIIFLNSACHGPVNTPQEISIKLDTLSENGKANIEKNLSKQEGVTFVKAHLRKKLLEIKYDSVKITRKKLFEEVEKLGY